MASQRAAIYLALGISLSSPVLAAPPSREWNVKPLPAIRQLVVTPTDRAAELDADARRGETTPLRYAAPAEVSVNPLTHGTWETVPGGRLWRLRVLSAGATDLNFGFSTCWLPEGATLHISAERENFFQGPYSARDNKPHGELWTPVVPGDRAVLELFVPADATEDPRLVLAQVNRGYRDFFHAQKDLSTAKAGNCNNDVVCALGDAWRNEIRSVARYSRNGSYLCTGTLVNNTSSTFKNYFLTANHCGVNAGNAATVVVYWNFESPVCGQHGGGSLTQNQSGATFRMSKTDVDVTLIELDAIPNSNFHVFYSGWDRSGVAPAGVVGIHHPNADEKSISFSTNAPTTVNSCIGAGTLTHWQVVWNLGVTEPGSSGSGIWDPATHRLIGTLSGGDSSCDLPQGPDCYGRFAGAWSGSGGPSGRLRDWLDPMNTGATSVGGRDPNPIPLLITAGSALVAEGCTPTNGVIDTGEAVTMRFSIRNFGASNSVNLVATLLATNGVTAPGAPQNYGVVVAGGPAVTRSFTFTGAGSCGSPITPTLQMRDGTNNLGTLTFSFRLGTPVITFAQAFDSASVPNLPAGWGSAGSNSPGWRTIKSLSQSPSNSAYATNLDFASEATLTSPSIAIVHADAQAIFHHYFDTEEGFDGGVLEISFNGGAFTDILAAGGSFVAGGYNDTLPTGYQNPLALRNAWTGNAGGFLKSIVNLPATAAAKNIRLRWRLGTDESVGGAGWFVDSFSIIDGYQCCQGPLPLRIAETRKTNNVVIFSFNTRTGLTYVTEFKSILNTNTAWTPLQTNVGDGSKKSVSNSAAAATRFYRIKSQ